MRRFGVFSWMYFALGAYFLASGNLTLGLVFLAFGYFMGDPDEDDAIEVDIEDDSEDKEEDDDDWNFLEDEEPYWDDEEDE